MKSPKKLIITIGDAHVYKDHEEVLKEQITRKPFAFPILSINSTKEYTKVEDFEINDFILDNYYYYDTLKMDMIA